MGERTHRIRRQIVEIEVADERDARSLQGRLSRLQRQRIAAAIERACDAVARGGETIRFDRVEIDLGEIAAEEVEEVLVERLRVTLEASLRRAAQGEAIASSVPRGAGAAAEVRRVDEVAAALEELTRFVRTGALPWWSDGHDAGRLRGRAAALHEASPGALVRLVRGLVAAGERVAVARLVAALDEPLLAALVDAIARPRRLVPIAGDGGIVAVAAEVAALLGAPQALADRSLEARGRLAWRGILAVAGRDVALGPETPNAEIYGLVLAEIAALVGRPLPGATGRLRELCDAAARGQAPPRGAASGAPGRAPVGADGARAVRRDLPNETDGRARVDGRVTGDTRSPGDSERGRGEASARETARRGAWGSLAAPGSDPRDAAASRAQGAARARAEPPSREAATPSAGAERARPADEPRSPADAQVDEAVAAWLTAAEDAVAALGAGPPGIEGRRRLDRLIAALVALAPLVARWPEHEVATRLVAAVDPARCERRGVEFSLMALVAGAGGKLDRFEVTALRRGLEAVAERTRAGERAAVRPVRGEEAPRRGDGALADADGAPLHVHVAEGTGEGQVRGEAAEDRQDRVEAAATAGAAGLGADAGRGEVSLDPEGPPRARLETARARERRRGAAARVEAPDRESPRVGEAARGAEASATAETTPPADASLAREDARVAARGGASSRAPDAQRSTPSAAASAPRGRASPAPTAARRRPAPALPSLADLREDTLYVDDAGMVVLWPFIPFFLRHLGLVDERSFTSREAQLRAAALLRVAVSGEREVAEHQLPLAKILCGVAIGDLFELEAPVRDEEVAEATAMLDAVIARAPILKRMSVAGLRGSFLLRPGALRVRDGAWLLQVERQGFDVVLDRFPWSFAWVKLPWMPEPLQVEW
ncbi:MAG: contractile injection system tape measure protein [Nannocystaceae bacterium]